MHNPEQPLTGAQITQLFANLNPDRIESRTQGGRSLSYLQGWDIRNSLIRVFGFGGWDAETVEYHVMRIDDVMSSANKPNFRVLATARVTLRIHQLRATFTEAAAASQQGSDIGEVTDFAIKTAETDAFKRCAVNLGTTFGLSLYDNGSHTDTVKRTVDPEQARIVKEYQAELEARAKKAAEDAGANTATGEVPDEPEGDKPPVTDEARGAAKAAAAKAFQK
jgi:recombination DNA repair RAD52 pathway protein